MKKRNQYDCFENYSRILIRRVARSLKSQFPDGAEDIEDHEQDLALRLHIARRAYDRSRSSPETFAKHVLASKAASMVIARSTKKRRAPAPPPPPPSPDRVDRERDAEVIDISDLMAVEREKERLADLEREVTRVETKLSREQRELCQHLKATGSVSAAARDMGKSRYWIYAEFEKIRPFFERVLQDAPDTFAASPVYPFRRKG